MTYIKMKNPRQKGRKPLVATVVSLYMTINLT